MDTFGPLFVAKVRASASSKPKASLRLRERVQHRFGGSAPARPRIGGGEAPLRAKGDGLVVVGASTGGPPALETMLGGLPSTFPWPLVIAQHMPVNFTGALPPARWHLRHRRQRGNAPDGARTGPRLYRARRRRCRHFEDRRRSRGVSSPGGHGASMASERRPVGGERHRAGFAEPPRRRPDDRNGR